MFGVGLGVCFRSEIDKREIGAYDKTKVKKVEVLDPYVLVS